MTFKYKEIDRVIAASLPDFELTHDDIDHISIDGQIVSLNMSHKEFDDCYVMLEIECSMKSLTFEVEFNNSTDGNPEWDDYANHTVDCPDLTQNHIIAKVVESEKVSILAGSLIELTDIQRRDIYLAVEELVENAERLNLSK